MPGTRHYGNWGAIRWLVQLTNSGISRSTKTTAITERDEDPIARRVFQPSESSELLQSASCRPSSPIRHPTVVTAGSASVRVNAVTREVGNGSYPHHRDRRRWHRQPVPGWRRSARHPVSAEVQLLSFADLGSFPGSSHEHREEHFLPESGLAPSFLAHFLLESGTLLRASMTANTTTSGVSVARRLTSRSKSVLTMAAGPSKPGLLAI